MKRLVNFLKRFSIRRKRNRFDYNRYVNYKSAIGGISELRERIKEPKWDEISFDEYDDISNYPISRLSEKAKREVIDIIRRDIEETTNQKAKDIENFVSASVGAWSPEIELTKL